MTEQDPSEQLAVRLRDAITRLNRRVRQARPVGDLTIAQLSALTSLELAGSLTAGELAETERVRPPTMTKVIAKLVERGLVAQQPHPTDGRRVVVVATPAGRALYEGMARERDQWLSGRLAQLTDDERQKLADAAEILHRVARD